jgi:hypothetical protein
VGKLTVILDGRGWLEVFNAMLLMWSQTTVSDTPVHAGVHHRDCRARRCRAGGGAAGPPRPVHARQDNRQEELQLFSRGPPVRNCRHVSGPNRGAHIDFRLMSPFQADR